MKFLLFKHLGTMRRKFELLFVFMLVSILQISCLTQGKNKDMKNIVEQEDSVSLIESYKKLLPYELMDKDMVVTDVNAEGNSVVYTISVQDKVWKSMSINKDVVNAEKDMARIISYIGKELVQNCIKEGMGIKYVYVSSNTKKVLKETEMSSDKLEEICKKIADGKIPAYTMLEMSNIEHKKIEFPYEIGDYELVTDTYVEGNNIYYIVKCDFEADQSRVSTVDFQTTKIIDIMRFREKALIFMHKKEIFEDNIHYVIVYKDNRGIEFIRDDISPKEMFATHDEIKKMIEKCGVPNLGQQ